MMQKLAFTIRDLNIYLKLLISGKIYPFTHVYKGFFLKQI